LSGKQFAKKFAKKDVGRRRLKMKNEKLYIPTKILDSDDFITGFSVNELAVTGCAAVFAALVGIWEYHNTGNTFIAVMEAIAIIALVIFIVRRDMCNENIPQKIKILVKDLKTQKRFKYQYTNIYEDILYDEE